MINGEEIIVKVERQYLDGMDEDTAMELAFEEDEIATRFNRDNIKVTSYNVEPGFRAVLQLHDPTSKYLSKKEKRKNKKKTKSSSKQTDAKIPAESAV